MAQDELELSAWREWFASLGLTPEEEDAMVNDPWLDEPWTDSEQAALQRAAATLHDGQPFDWDSMPNHPLHPDRPRPQAIPWLVSAAPMSALPGGVEEGKVPASLQAETGDE